jgi:hypothetical protein
MNDEKQGGRRGPIVVGVHLGNRSYGGGLVWGVLITLVGVALLLDHMGIINVYHFWRFWPLILIVAGAANLSCRESRLWGIILVLAGVLFQLNQLGVAHFGWAEMWPIVLIAVGVLIIWGSLESKIKRTASPRDTGDPRTTLNETVVFGGIERRVTTQDFQGGHVNAVFGGVELDLRDANMQADEATLELMPCSEALNSAYLIPGRWPFAALPFLAAFPTNPVPHVSPCPKTQKAKCSSLPVQ